MVAGGVLLVVALGYLALVQGPRWLVNPKGLTAGAQVKAENDVRGTLAQALGGLVLLVGLYFTASSYAASKTSQITERFSRAIAQLGDQEINVRIGALYALESIGRDSSQTYATVVDIFVRFIRERTPNTSAAEPHDEFDVPVGGDVKVALELLGRRHHHRHERERLQFRELVLPDVVLCGNYQEADFCDSHLDSSTLTRSNF